MIETAGVFHRIALSGRLGQRVFLRCQITGPAERALTALAEALVSAVALFDDAPASLQSWGDEAAGALHCILLFRSGSCVLVYTAHGNEAVDALLLGNHGAAYGPGASGSPFLRSEEHRTGLPSGAADQFVALIHRSLSARQPVRIEGWGDG
jgi:hypothetical protein